MKKLDFWLPFLSGLLFLSGMTICFHLVMHSIGEAEDFSLYLVLGIICLVISVYLIGGAGASIESGDPDRKSVV